MKTPFPAFWIRSLGAPSCRVTIEPCEVLAVYRTQGNSEIKTPHGTTYVNNHDLASTLVLAVAKVSDRLQLHLSPAPAEKSATAEMAGAGEGDNFAAAQNRRTSPADADDRKASGECAAA